MEKAVKEIKRSSPGVNPYAVASTTLQKSGTLKKGTNTATKKGLARGPRAAPSATPTRPDALKR